MDYPAPGAPELAAEVEEIVKPTWVGQDVDSWGLDHGTWSVLTHMYPDADIPVVQLSINAMKPFDYHLELGREAGPAAGQRGADRRQRQRGAQPRRDRPSRPDSGFDWAHRFDDARPRVMTGAPDTLPGVQAAPDFDAAVPTPDHFIPLLYLAGLGAAAGRGADVLVDGYAYGSLSMTAYTLDLPARSPSSTMPGAGCLPADGPPDGANI